MFGKGRELRQLLDGFHEMRESVDGALRQISDTVSEHSEQISAHDKAIDRLERMVMHCGTAERSHKKEIVLQQEQIDKLKQRVDKLIHDRDEIIWDDPTRAAFERKSIQRAASKEKLSYQAAMQVLSDLGILVRDKNGKRTRSVRKRSTGEVVRAVVVIKEGNIDA